MRITIEAEGQEAEALIRLLGPSKTVVQYEKPEEKIKVPVEKKTKRLKPEVPREEEPANNWAPGGGEVPVEQEDKPEPVHAIKIEDLRKILVDKSKGGKQKEVAALIKSYGVDSLVHVPQEKWAELLEKAEWL